ncbi:MAG TPA: helix-turn-helix domain-containing protein [Mycobacteriales bacterium]|jgi:DNA-binding PucR family transcriptional regulator
MTTYTLPGQRLAPDGPAGEPALVPDTWGTALDELCSTVFARPHLRMPQLAALRAHDAAHGSEYVATLAACLDSLGNVAASAERLGVHVNTFRYRMRRLAEVAGDDLSRADTRLVLGLELAAPADLATAPAPPVDVDAPQWRWLPPDAPVVVAAFRVVGDDDDAPCRLARMVALSWDAFRTSAWCDITGHTVYSVVAAGSAAAADTVTATVRRMVREAESSLGLRVLAGIGPVVAGVREVEASRRLADEVLRAVADRPGGDHVASLDEVRTTVVLRAFAAAAAEWPDVDGGAAARLAAHDAEHGTAYAATLRAYLECFGDVAAAAARSYVHVRTFRYRLRRIEELSGLRLDDPTGRLAAHLELRVRH